MVQSLTPEEQRAYVRQRLAGYAEANAFVAAERRARTEEERWADANELQQNLPTGQPSPPDESAGIVEQQRLFRRLARP